MKETIRVHPLTAERWDDFETLFGPRGACAGCWCMWWRLKRSEWTRWKGRLDDRPVWSITCFFVARDFRRKGVTVTLLREAATYVRKRKAKLLEGYPVEPRKDSVPDVWVFTGLAGAFRKAGFREAARPTETRRIMRLDL